MNPYELLPEEMWENIFNNIEEDKDKFNFLQSHFHFKEQFKKEYVKLRDAFALHVLMDYFEKKTPDWSWELNRERRKSVLSCRLVSRNWCKAVDNWMESFCDTEKVDLPRVLVKENEDDCTDLASRPGVERFMEHFGELQVNAITILSRAVEIGIPLNEREPLQGLEYPPLEQEIEDSQMIKDILSKIGGDIKSLNVNLTLDIEGRNREVEQLRIETCKSVLELVPNLKYLQVCWEPISQLDLRGEDADILEFPDLPHLVNLWISPSELDDAEEGIVTDLAPFEMYFPQLTCLTLDGFVCWKDEYVEARRFPKLHHLELQSVVISDQDQRRKLFGICGNLFAPNLESLSLRIMCFRSSWNEKRKRTGKWLLQKLLRLLNKTFKNEKVKWKGVQNEDEDELYDLELKRV